jgi:RNA polymerase sigma-70 factor (TIGR02957 family)
MTRAEEFEQLRPLLFSIAYRILGSVSEAEDAVQETWLDFQAYPARPDSVKAFLTTVVTRISINVLRSARVRREEYAGPWLPEPLLADPYEDPERSAELADSISMAALLLLERLSPLERAVFVLREVFGLPVAEVARALGRGEAAVRQMAHRAREHVQARQPRFDTDRRAQQEVTERFFAAVAGGNMDALLAALAPDVVLISDGGGKASAARRPITGAEKVARFLVGIAEKGGDIPGLRIEVAEVNGLPAIVGWVGTEPFGSISLAVADGRIEQVLVVVNPDKLAGLVLP